MTARAIRRRRGLSEVPTMRDAVAKRAESTGRTDNQRAYFRLSVCSAEASRLRVRLDELRVAERLALHRLAEVEQRISRIREQVTGTVGTARRRRAGWTEIELRY